MIDRAPCDGITGCMTIPEIKKRIVAIQKLAKLPDDEVAHEREDQLYHDFIVHVSESSDKDLSEKAKLVLSTKLIKFSRWTG